MKLIFALIFVVLTTVVYASPLSEDFRDAEVSKGNVQPKDDADIAGDDDEEYLEDENDDDDDDDDDDLDDDDDDDDDDATEDDFNEKGNDACRGLERGKKIKL